MDGLDLKAYSLSVLFEMAIAAASVSVVNSNTLEHRSLVQRIREEIKRRDQLYVVP